MKGPYERLKYDLRRVWECPRCHHRERTPGTVTSCICRCQAKEEMLKRVCMVLVEDGARLKKAANHTVPESVPEPPAAAPEQVAQEPAAPEPAAPVPAVLPAIDS